MPQRGGGDPPQRPALAVLSVAFVVILLVINCRDDLLHRHDRAAAGAGAASVAAIAGEVADAAIALPEDARGPAAAVIALTVGAGAVAVAIPEAAGAAAAIALPEDARGPAAGAAATKGCAGWRFQAPRNPGRAATPSAGRGCAPNDHHDNPDKPAPIAHCRGRNVETRGIDETGLDAVSALIPLQEIVLRVISSAKIECLRREVPVLTRKVVIERRRQPGDVARGRALGSGRGPRRSGTRYAACRAGAPFQVMYRAKLTSLPARFSAMTEAASFADRVTRPRIRSRSGTACPGDQAELLGERLAA